MKKSLRIFNPDHDLAMANDDENFNPPLSAKVFATDAADITRWYTNPIITDLPYVVPWGWNKALRKQLRLRGIDEPFLPSDKQLEDIRRLSHRQWASKLLDFIRESYCSERNLFPCDSAVSLTHIDEVRDFASRGKVMFKAPWSGSGRGIIIASEFSDTVEKKCNSIIAKQGSVMGEVFYDVKQNFAMEFYCKSHDEILFTGYSLFETKNNVYEKSLLLANDEIERRLCRIIKKGAETQKEGGTRTPEKKIDMMNVDENNTEVEIVVKDVLSAIREVISDFLKHFVAPSYTGPVGVDMFIYRDSDFLKIHPAVEINLRMTMGMIARNYYDMMMGCIVKGDNNVKYGTIGNNGSRDIKRGMAGGFMEVKHFITAEERALYYDKIKKGEMISLCDLKDNTQYGVFVYPATTFANPII